MVAPLVRPALGVTVAALALTIATAGAASAAITVTPPDQVRVKPGTTIIVKVQSPEGSACATDWSMTIDGKRKVVKSVSAVTCNGDLATWRVKVSLVKRGTADINFTAAIAPVDTVLDDGTVAPGEAASESIQLTITIKRPTSARPESSPPSNQTIFTTAVGAA